MLIGLTDDFALFNSWVRLTTIFSEQSDFTGEADCPQVDLLVSFPSVGIQASMFDEFFADKPANVVIRQPLIEEDLNLHREIPWVPTQFSRVIQALP
jgi:hypothetical protein